MLIILLPAIGGAETFWLRADGTEATIADSTNCNSAANASSAATHNSASFNDNDIIIILNILYPFAILANFLGFYLKKEKLLLILREKY